MNTSALIAQIDSEIAKLQHAHTVISAIHTGAEPAKRRGRPPKNAAPVSAASPRKRKPLSAAARKKIAAAQRKRWAERKKVAQKGA